MQAQAQAHAVEPKQLNPTHIRCQTLEIEIEIEVEMEVDMETVRGPSVVGDVGKDSV